MRATFLNRQKKKGDRASQSQLRPAATRGWKQPGTGPLIRFPLYGLSAAFSPGPGNAPFRSFSSRAPWNKFLIGEVRSGQTDLPAHTAAPTQNRACRRTPCLLSAEGEGVSALRTLPRKRKLKGTLPRATQRTSTGKPLKSSGFFAERVGWEAAIVDAGM